MSDMFTSKTDTDSEDGDIQQPVALFKTFGLSKYDDKPFFGVRRLLKRNPSLKFCREVIQMNKQELDPAEVQQVSLHHFHCCAVHIN
jgi:hypothetical protein